MSAAQREQILQALWPQGSQSRLGVWAVLDCARDPKIYSALLASRLEFRCLYSGQLPRALDLVAPQLVELAPNNRLTASLLDDGWGQAWGIFVKIDDPANLRHHLRKFLKVQDEDGRRLLFRYYDPRVLRAYLPTCQPDEWQQVFGPVAAFVTEAGDGQSLLEFTRTSNQLLTRRIVLAPNAIS